MVKFKNKVFTEKINVYQKKKTNTFQMLLLLIYKHY